jgi:hypothetical protein
MNAALISKSAKGLALASSIALATSVSGFAQDAPVTLGATATTPLGALYLNPPTGPQTLGGKPFAMGNFSWLAAGQSATFAAAFPSPNGVYVLLNSSYTSGWYAGYKVGSVQLTFSDATTQFVDLVVGKNVREWQIGAGGMVSTVSDPSNSNVWAGVCCNGSTAAAIDMLSVSIPPTTKSLATVAVSNTDTTGGGIHLQVNGVSVSYSPPAPTPAPVPSGGDQQGQHQGQHADGSKPAAHATPTVTAKATAKPDATSHSASDQQGQHSGGGDAKSHRDG